MHRDKVPGLLLYYVPLEESAVAISKCIDEARAVFGVAYKPAREPHLTVTYSLLNLDHESFRDFTTLVSSIIGASDTISANTLPHLKPLGRQAGRVSLGLVFDPASPALQTARNISKQLSSLTDQHTNTPETYHVGLGSIDTTSFESVGSAGIAAIESHIPTTLNFGSLQIKGSDQLSQAIDDITFEASKLSNPQRI